MKLFVTGGTGFVGSHFVNEAHRRGHELTVLRRSSDSQPRVTLDHQPRWVTASLDAPLSQYLLGHDAVVHLAAHTPNVPYDTLENCLYWNVTASLKLFRSAYGVGIRRFIAAGSCFEYGAAAERYEYVPTDAPLEATLSYPCSKAVASRVFAAMASDSDASVTIARIFQVYGPGEAATRLWPSLMAAANEGRDFNCSAGEQTRDFVPVQDVAVQIADLLNSKPDPGNIHIKHIGTGRPQTLRQFVEQCWAQAGATGRLHFGTKPYREGEIMRLVPKID